MEMWVMRKSSLLNKMRYKLPKVRWQEIDVENILLVGQTIKLILVRNGCGVYGK
jgi:hypothetical protein